MDEHPDGWALSTSRDGLRGAFPESGAPRGVLALCPADVRVAVWVRGRRDGRSRRPHNLWEPLLVYGGRPDPEGVAEDLGDVLMWNGRQHSHPLALVGMKPAPFAEWMFRQLGALRGDTLADLFPGSGAIGRAWEMYVSPPTSKQLTLDLGATTEPSLAAANDGKPSRLEEARERLRRRLAPAHRDG